VKLLAPGGANLPLRGFFRTKEALMYPLIRQGVLSSPSTRLTARVALALLAMLALGACERDEPLAPTPETDVLSNPIDGGGFALATTLGGPIAGLTPEELARFEAGREDFQEIETIEDGLGPVFNEAGCVECHNDPIGGTTGRLETRFGKWEKGKFDPLDRYGGSLMQDQAIGKVRVEGRRRDQRFFTFEPEVVPRRANQTALRNTQSLFGLGLVDAIPDATLIALANRQPRDTRGKVHMVKEIRTGAMRASRFGWKAQVPTLFQFAGDAYLNEMGITNPEFPNENLPQGDEDALKFNPVPGLQDDGEGVDLFTDFMTFLGPPPRGPTNSETKAGEKVFLNIGCANCHTPTHQTGFSPVQALSNKTFHPFSDFLLHDMGKLGDGIVQGNARAKEMRTAPLWGLMARPTFLHDGRATTPEAAILAHDGQGRDARRNFERLDSRERRSLIAFLESL
jgi:CxxC motif-containing protein (DUF1111 family)